MAHDNQTSSITILIPAYNEDHSIAETIQTIKKLHPELKILVVDDGSSDNTLKAAMDTGVDVWPHPYNIGNGAAIKSGLRCVNTEWVLMMDADGQHSPEDISRLIQLKDNYDMVVGARTKQSETSMHRDFANWLYSRLASYVTKFKVEDLTSGFRLVRTSTVRQFIYLLPNTFSYPTTLTMAYLRSGLSVKYVPIKTKARKGKSKIKLLRDGTRFFLIITKIATLFAPLRIFLPISCLLFTTGCGYYLFTYLTQGRFTNMSALFIQTSVIVFLMGLISEQISQMRYDRVDRGER